MAKTLVRNPKFDPKNPQREPKQIALQIDKALHIEQAKGDGRYTVTQVRGLYLDVRRMREGETTPMRVWTLRIMHGHKLNAKGERKPNIIERTIGYHPDVTLSAARETAILWAREVRSGSEVGKQAKERPVKADMVIFRHAAEAEMERLRPSWKSKVHAHQWKQTLETYAYPLIGNHAVADVTMDDIVTILKPIWHEKHATAVKLRHRLGMVLDWAVEEEYRTTNPVHDKKKLSRKLGEVKKSKRHHAALPYKQVAEFMRDLRALGSVSALALEFTILTGCRTSEVLEATWDELQDDVWVIPAKRMKADEEHRVPLSPSALAVIEKVRPLSRGDWLFPSRFSHLSNMAMLECLRGLRAGMTVHGFRSTFRDWAADQTDYPHEIAEAALAHTVSEDVVASYRRTTFFDKRRDLMNDWANHCDGKELTAPVDEVAELKAQLAKQAAQIDVLLRALAK